MKPTRPSVLLALVVVGALVAWLVVRATYADLPAIPRIGPATLLVLALIEAATARAVRDRLAGRPRTVPISPLTVARCAALARASSAAGALFTGGYVGLGIFTLGGLDKPAYAHDGVTSLLGIAASLLLVAAALWLERVCRVRRPPDEPRIGSAA